MILVIWPKDYYHLSNIKYRHKIITVQYVPYLKTYNIKQSTVTFKRYIHASQRMYPFLDFGNLMIPPFMVASEQTK